MGSRWAGAVMGGGLGPWWEEGFATYLACGGPQCLLERWVLRGVGTPRRGGQALGLPVCKLDPGRAGGPIALLRGGNEG